MGLRCTANLIVCLRYWCASAIADYLIPRPKRKAGPDRNPALVHPTPAGAYWRGPFQATGADVGINSVVSLTWNLALITLSRRGLTPSRWRGACSIRCALGNLFSVTFSSIFSFDSLPECSGSFRESKSLKEACHGKVT